MHRGYIKLWRRVDTSEVSLLPHSHFRVWCWVLTNACHKALTVSGITLEPGELLTTYGRIGKALEWRENRSFHKLSTRQLRTAVQNLVNLQMLELRQEVRQGCLRLKVLHWSEYQGTNDRTATGIATELRQDLDRTATTEQEGKKEKTDKKEPKTLVQAAPKNGAPPDGFDEWWRAWPKKVDKGHAVKAYRSALRKASAQTILEGLESQLGKFSAQEVKFIPHPSTWLNGERWADEGRISVVVNERAVVVSNLRSMLKDGYDEIMVRGLCAGYEERGEHAALWTEVKNHA